MDNSQANDEMGLVYQANLPISVSQIGKEQADFIPENLRFRYILPLLDDASVSNKLTERSSTTNSEILRMEAKLDLVIELLGQIYNQELVRPKAVPMLISSRSIRWQTDDVLTVGDAICIKIYFSSEILIPLEINADVTAVKQAENAQSVITATFRTMDEGIRDWLERYIFKQHRRQVAQTHTS